MHIVTVKYKDGSAKQRNFFSKYNADTLMNNIDDDIGYLKDRSKYTGATIETIADKKAA